MVTIDNLLKVVVALSKTKAPTPTLYDLSSAKYRTISIAVRIWHFKVIQGR